ncbi:tumor necrosis factor receptor superfamily member 25 [Protopterus annectens]|uniref:tumor necrosis factor receptor superfamily member 25 n=1 Tax=Protopterus annectens TaxID=7888 RepID=UPI001CFB5FFB|nr:tumor necrosis factor receptor superfamily member 25 [Protopterus annectens]
MDAVDIVLDYALFLTLNPGSGLQSSHEILQLPLQAAWSTENTTRSWVTENLVFGRILNMLQERRLYKRNTFNYSCAGDEYWDKTKRHCCKKCEPGNYKESPCNSPGTASICKPCGKGTFLAHKNDMTSCSRCTLCDDGVHQIEIEECRPEHDRQCGCGPGNYKVCFGKCDTFHCKPCSECKTGKVIKECAQTGDAICNEGCYIVSNMDKVCKNCSE